MATAAVREIPFRCYEHVMMVHISYKIHSYITTARVLKVEIRKLMTSGNQGRRRNGSWERCDALVRCNRLAEDLSKRYITYISSLGRGGFGVVHKVKIPRTREDKEYALKEVAIKDPHNVLHQIIKERDLMTGLRHDNILRLRACWAEHGNANTVATACFLMDFMPRGDLETVSRQLHPFISYVNFKSCYNPMMTFNQLHAAMLEKIRIRTPSTPDDPTKWDPIYRFDFRKHLARKEQICVTNMSVVYNQQMRIYLVYVLELIYGLMYLHECGIAHRDLKPQNVLVDARCHLKISDFGLSSKLNYRHVRESYRYLDRTRTAFNGREYLLRTVEALNERVSQVLNRPERPVREVTKGFHAPENLEAYYSAPGQSSYRVPLEKNYKEDIFTAGVTLYHVMSGMTPTVVGGATSDSCRRTFIEESNRTPHKGAVISKFAKYGSLQANNPLITYEGAQHILLHKDLARFVTTLLTTNAEQRPARPDISILNDQLRRYEINKYNPAAVDIYFAEDQFSSAFSSRRNRPPAGPQPFQPTFPSGFGPNTEPVDIPDFAYLSPTLPISISPKHKPRPHAQQSLTYQVPVNSRS